MSTPFKTLSLALLLFISGCASAPKPAHSTAPANGKTAVEDGGFLEISYLRGRDMHRCLIQIADSKPMAEIYSDRTLLRKGQIDPDGYSKILDRVNELFSSSERKPADTEAEISCHSSYRLKLRSKGETRVLSGCGSTPEGSEISRITRDAELLLFSQKTDQPHAVND